MPKRKRRNRQVSRAEQLKRWSAVDEKVKRYGVLERQVESLQIGFKDRVTDAETELKSQIEPLKKEMEILRADIKLSYDRRKGSLLPSKTIKLAHGIIGEVKDPKKVIVQKGSLDKIRNAGLADDYIRREETVNKAMLRDADREVLQQVGAKVTQGSRFKIKTIDPLAVPTA